MAVFLPQIDETPTIAVITSKFSVYGMITGLKIGDLVTVRGLQCTNGQWLARVYNPASNVEMTINLNCISTTI